MSVHDRWKRDGVLLPKDERPAGKRYLVRWREQGRQQKLRFETRYEADREDARHRYADPDDTVHEGRRLTVEQMMATWLSTRDVEASTRLAYEQDVRRVNATFGDRLASTVTHTEVRQWVARDAGRSARQRSLVALRSAYQLAILEQLLKVDPTYDAKVGKGDPAPRRFLDWSELGRLADECGQDAALVWLLGTCGLRLSEAIALDGTDVDWVRGRIKVRTSKTHRAREVPIIDEDVQTWLAEILPARPGPLFVGARGGRLNAHNWRERVFKPGARRAGLGEMHPHELRHTAASLAIASGADAGVVQRMLGHASAAMTLDLYRHLFDRQLDDVVASMRVAKRTALGTRRGTHEGTHLDAETGEGTHEGTPTPDYSEPLPTTPGGVVIAFPTRRNAV